MYICVCKAVTERQIRQAAARGVVSLRELTREFQLGSCCGKCVPSARALLDELTPQKQCKVAQDAQPAPMRARF